MLPLETPATPEVEYERLLDLVKVKTIICKSYCNTMGDSKITGTC